MEYDPIQIGEIDQSDDLGAGLHNAARTGNRKSLKKVLQSGIHVDYPNERGQTPLFCACYFNHEATAELLLSHNANPDERCNDGLTPVHVTCYSGNIRLLRKLLSYGGDLRLHDGSGRTVKDWSMQQPDPKKRLRMIEFLEKTRLFAMTNSGKDIFNREISSKLNRSFTGNTSIIDMLKHRLASAVDTKENTNKDILKSVHSIGYGKVYTSNTQNGLISTVPLVPEIMLKHDSFGLTFESGIGMVFESMMWNNTSVTIKRPHREEYISQVVDLLIHESDYLGKLHHPNILLLMGICQTNNLDGMVLIFERVQLGSLFLYLHQRYERLPTKDIQAILLQIADALVYIHDQNLVHGNVSSHAVNLVSTHVAKLGNFDCMVEMRDTSKTTSHLKRYMKKEVWNWMGPEVWNNYMPAPESDVYSFCAVVWEIHTNVMPWETVDFEDAKQRVAANMRWDGFPLSAGKIPRLMNDIIEYGLHPEPTKRSLSMTQIRDILLACPKDLKEYLKISEQKTHKHHTKNPKSKQKSTLERSWKESRNEEPYVKDHIVYSEEFSDGVSNTLSVRSESEKRTPRQKSSKKKENLTPRRAYIDDNNSSNHGDNEMPSSRRNSKSPMYQRKSNADPVTNYQGSPDRFMYDNYQRSPPDRYICDNYGDDNTGYNKQSYASSPTYSPENKRLHVQRTSVSPYNTRHSLNHSDQVYMEHQSPVSYQDAVNTSHHEKEYIIRPEMIDKAESPLSLHDYITKNSPVRSPETGKSPTNSENRRSSDKWGSLKRQASAVLRKKANIFKRKSSASSSKSKATSPDFTDLAKEYESNKKYVRSFEESEKYFPSDNEKYYPRQKRRSHEEHIPPKEYRLQNGQTLKPEIVDFKSESGETSEETYKELPVMKKRSSFSPQKFSYLNLAQLQQQVQPQQMACKPASHVVVPPSEKIGQLTTSGSIFALYNQCSPEEKEINRAMHFQKSASLDYRRMPPHRTLRYAEPRVSNLDSPDKQWFGGKGSVRNLVHLYQNQEDEHKFQQDVLSRDLTSGTKLNELHRKDVNSLRKQVFLPNQPYPKSNTVDEHGYIPTVVHDYKNMDSHPNKQFQQINMGNNSHQLRFTQEEPMNVMKVAEQHFAGHNFHQQIPYSQMEEKVTKAPQPTVQMPPCEDHIQPVQRVRRKLPGGVAHLPRPRFMKQNIESKLNHVFQEQRSRPEPSAPVLSQTTFDRVFGNQNQTTNQDTGKGDMVGSVPLGYYSKRKINSGRPEIPPLDLRSESSDVKHSDSRGSLTSVSLEDSASITEIKGDSLESQLVNRWVSKELRKVSKEFLAGPPNTVAQTLDPELNQSLNKGNKFQVNKLNVLSDLFSNLESPDLFDSYEENDTTIKANEDVGKNLRDQCINDNLEESRVILSDKQFTQGDCTQGEYYFDDELQPGINEVTHFQLYSPDHERRERKTEDFEISREEPGRRKRSKSTEVAQKREKSYKNQERKMRTENKKCYERKVVIHSSVDQPGKHVVQHTVENDKTGDKKVLDKRLVEGSVVTSTFTFI